MKRLARLLGLICAICASCGQNAFANCVVYKGTDAVGNIDSNGVIHAEPWGHKPVRRLVSDGRLEDRNGFVARVTDDGKVYVGQTVVAHTTSPNTVVSGSKYAHGISCSRQELAATAYLLIFRDDL